MPEVEIAEVDHAGEPAALVHQHVARVEVAMHECQRRGQRQRRQTLVEEIEPRGRVVDGAACREIGQRRPHHLLEPMGIETSERIGWRTPRFGLGPPHVVEHSEESCQRSRQRSPRLLVEVHVARHPPRQPPVAQERPAIRRVRPSEPLGPRDGNWQPRRECGQHACFGFEQRHGEGRRGTEHPVAVHEVGGVVPSGAHRFEGDR